MVLESSNIILRTAPRALEPCLRTPRAIRRAMRPRLSASGKLLFHACSEPAKDRTQPKTDVEFLGPVPHVGPIRSNAPGNDPIAGIARPQTANAYT